MIQRKIQPSFPTQHEVAFNQRMPARRNGQPGQLRVNQQIGMHLLIRGAIWLGIVFAISFHSPSRIHAQTTPKDDREIIAAYNAAIYDSSVHKFSNLRPLYPLQFDRANRAKVVTLAWREYHKGRMKLMREVWVTPFPEVKNLCQNFTGDIALRLKQLLGLPPAANVVHFVEISVRRGDVFRPTTDRKTTSSFPCASPVTPECGVVFPNTLKRKDKYVRWFADKMLSSYVIAESTLTPVGYPWTRLGYTYDWRPGSNKYGASEYVIRKGATVTILAEPFPIETYCKSKE